MRTLMKKIFLFCYLVASVSLFSFAQSYDVSSPDKTVMLSFLCDEEGRLYYDIKVDEELFFNTSQLGFQEKNGVELSRGFKVVETEETVETVEAEAVEQPEAQEGKKPQKKSRRRKRLKIKIVNVTTDLHIIKILSFRLFFFLAEFLLSEYKEFTEYIICNRDKDCRNYYLYKPVINQILFFNGLYDKSYFAQQLDKESFE